MLNLNAGIARRLFRFDLAWLMLLAGLAVQPAWSDVVDQTYQPSPYVKITHPEWSRNAVIYELNTRQFTPEGTFAAAAKQLPRLRELGVVRFKLSARTRIGGIHQDIFRDIGAFILNRMESSEIADMAHLFTSIINLDVRKFKALS